MGRAKIKLLLVGESCTLPSSTAEIVRNVFRSLIARFGARYELRQVALYYSFSVVEPSWPTYGTRTTIEGQEHRFVQSDMQGFETVQAVLPDYCPDIVIGVGRPEEVSYLAGLPCLVMLVLRISGRMLAGDLSSQLKEASRILVMSEESRRLLEEKGHATVDWLCRPADCARFIPVSRDEKSLLRHEVLPEGVSRDAFILGWVGKNRWNKQLWLLFKVVHFVRTGKYLVCKECGRVTLFDWNPLTRTHADSTGVSVESKPGCTFNSCGHCGSEKVSRAEPLPDVVLWCHTPLCDPMEAFPLEYLEWEFGVTRNVDIFYTPGYGLEGALPPDAMPTLYQVWDCLLYLTGREELGLPAWEAMCSGLPVIYTDYSEHGRHLSAAGGGLPVNGILQPEEKTGHWNMIADATEAIRAIRTLYYDRKLCARLGANGRTYVQKYNLNWMAEQWHDLLQSLLSEQSGDSPPIEATDDQALTSSRQ